ncbi:hypothetical protein ACFPN1_07110 [Lysobacter yangpyeongensis]|uniref:Uncharacterized protein n=1 Tax=Lysobacter yangpyeongensis TaxID=346182 RepID=A0ABW0SLC2_9GAMM
MPALYLRVQEREDAAIRECLPPGSRGRDGAAMTSSIQQRGAPLR